MHTYRSRYLRHKCLNHAIFLAFLWNSSFSTPQFYILLFYVNDHQPRPDMLLEKIQYKKNKRQLGPVCSLTCCSVFYLLANGNMCVMVSTIFTFSNALSAEELIAAKRGICYIWVQRGTSWSQPSSYSYSTIMTAPQSSSLHYVMCPCIL